MVKALKYKFPDTQYSAATLLIRMAAIAIKDSSTVIRMIICQANRRKKNIGRNVKNPIHLVVSFETGS